MAVVVVMAVVLLAWGVAMVWIDYRAQRRAREAARRRTTDTSTVGEEAEWWLRHH